MKETSIERKVYSLMEGALALSQILDQPVDKKGMISVNYSFASELIRDAQLGAMEAADLLTFFSEEFGDNLEDIGYDPESADFDFEVKVIDEPKR